jgi:hypothetical protein
MQVRMMVALPKSRKLASMICTAWRITVCQVAPAVAARSFGLVALGALPWAGCNLG